MPEPVIRVRDLGKRYSLRTSTSASVALRRGIGRLFRRGGGRSGEGGKQQAFDAAEDVIWSLRDVTFDVDAGEVVGIIGRNGAGKSTLLKILSRITEPTTGYAEVEGRVGTLLEVGTGFNPDLSGRENVYLSGAILGMTHREIRRRFDEIIAFAELEKFVDTPVKHYSSGMYMRLAFSVAASLDHEILLVDEVLAVGDATFQKKCTGRMTNAARSGRTILFVSHSMAAVSALCSRAILLEGGRVVKDGPVEEVVGAYQVRIEGEIGGLGYTDLRHASRYGTGKVQFRSLRMTPYVEGGTEEPVMRTGSGLQVDVEIDCAEAISDANVAVTVYDSNGYRLVDVNSALKGKYLNLREGDTARLAFRLRDLLLKPGDYVVGLWVGRLGMEDTDGISQAARIHVEPELGRPAHSVIYPGPYQCRFDVESECRPARTGA